MKSESEKNMLNNKKVETYSRGPNKWTKKNETRLGRFVVVLRKRNNSEEVGKCTFFFVFVVKLKESKVKSKKKKKRSWEKKEGRYDDKIEKK